MPEIIQFVKFSSTKKKSSAVKNCNASYRIKIRDS